MLGPPRCLIHTSPVPSLEPPGGSVYSRPLPARSRGVAHCFDGAVGRLLARWIVRNYRCETSAKAVAMGKVAASHASSTTPLAAYFSIEPVVDALLLIITFQPVLANLYFGGDVAGLPYQASMLLHASFIVLSGSIKAARAHAKHTEAQKAASVSGKENTETHFESLTSADVYKFPFMASASLLSLFFALQYFKDWVNFLLSLYFSAIGVFALFAVVEPCVSKPLPPQQ
jgi:hypothetical protein